MKMQNSQLQLLTQKSKYRDENETGYVAAAWMPAVGACI
jgi:hypothetical protein